jgi:hypothetical protein
MDNITVARFFGHLWPSYCKDGLEIELLKFWHIPPHASPFWAAVVWDRDKWAILADENEEPRRLFGQLFHEAAHVINGDVTKQGYGRELLKRAATGCLVWEDEAREVKAETKASKGTAPARRRERLADSWADIEARRWWAVLEGLGDSPTDEAMSRAIRNHNRG